MTDCSGRKNVKKFQTVLNGSQSLCYCGYFSTKMTCCDLQSNTIKHLLNNKPSQFTRRHHSNVSHLAGLTFQRSFTYHQADIVKMFHISLGRHGRNVSHLAGLSLSVTKEHTSSMLHLCCFSSIFSLQRHIAYMLSVLFSITCLSVCQS